MLDLTRTVRCNTANSGHLGPVMVLGGCRRGAAVHFLTLDHVGGIAADRCGALIQRLLPRPGQVIVHLTAVVDLKRTGILNTANNKTMVHKYYMPSKDTATENIITLSIHVCVLRKYDQYRCSVAPVLCRAWIKVKKQQPSLERRISHEEKPQWAGQQ